MATKFLFTAFALIMSRSFWIERPYAVQGFVPELISGRKIKPLELRMASPIPLERSPASLLLPPLPEQARKQISTQEMKRKNNRADAYNRKWRGQSLPEIIPRLSEVMKKQESTLKNSSSALLKKATSSKATKNSVEEHSSQSSKEDNDPWKAGYYTSLKSQKRIQDAATNPRRKIPLERAAAVLETFLSTPPTKCNSANLVCALTLSAKVMGDETSDSFRSLLYRTNNILCQVLEDKSLSARQLCNVAWALAKHSDRDDRLLPVAPEATGLGSDSVVFGQAETWDLRIDIAGCPAQQVDTTIDEIAKQLTAILRDDIRAAKEGELCMASWAYGILRRRRRPPGWQHGPQLSKLPTAQNKPQQEQASHFIKFEQWGSNINNVADNGGDSGVPCATGALLDTIGRALCEPLKPDSSLDSMQLNAHQRIRRCSWSELANVAWAFASHGQSCSPDAQALLAAIASEASRRLNENGAEAKQALSRDIAQIIWSLGTLQADNFRLGDSLVQFVDAVAVFTRGQGPSEFRKWSCADIVQVVLSMAHARLDELPMMHGLYTEAFRRLDSKDDGGSMCIQSRRTFLSWETSVLLWAQARFYLNESHGQIFGLFARKAVSAVNAALQRGSSFSSIGIGPQEQANMAWSLTVLELYSSSDAVGLLGAIFTEAATSCQHTGVIQLEHAHQLWQALFLLEDECPVCVEMVPEWFRDYLRDKWYVEKARPKMSSARHISLSKTLNLMGVAHFNEHDEDIDVAIVLQPNASWTHETEKSSVQDGVRVAVEFDGPHHFTRPRLAAVGTTPEQPRALGHTVLKYRLLKKQGWTVVRVPYYEFDKIPFWASMERQRYLQRLLKTHGNLRFSVVDVSEYKAHVSNRGSRYD